MTVVALSQEDDDVDGFRKLAERLEDLPFTVVGDIDRRGLPQLGRTTAYWIDGSGLVRQVFPMETYRRANLDALRNEILRRRREPLGEAGEAGGNGR